MLNSSSKGKKKRNKDIPNNILMLLKMSVYHLTNLYNFQCEKNMCSKYKITRIWLFTASGANSQVQIVENLWVFGRRGTKGTLWEIGDCDGGRFGVTMRKLQRTFRSGSWFPGSITLLSHITRSVRHAEKLDYFSVKKQN